MRVIWYQTGQSQPCDSVLCGGASGGLRRRDAVPMTDPTPLRAPRIRRAGIPDDAVLVVRGDDLEPGMSRGQAIAFLRRFPDWGRYGLSAYYARGDAEVDDLAADQLERFAVLAVFEMAALVGAGFEVVPTFRTPHVTVAFTCDLDQHLVALVQLQPRVVENPYHEREPGE